MFHLALPTPTAMLVLETSTRQLTLRAATASPESFPSPNYITSNMPYRVMGAGGSLLSIPCGRICPSVRRSMLAALGIFAL